MPMYIGNYSLSYLLGAVKVAGGPKTSSLWCSLRSAGGAAADPGKAGAELQPAQRAPPLVQHLQKLGCEVTTLMAT